MFQVEEDYAIRRYIEFLHFIGVWSKGKESKLRKYCKQVGFSLLNLFVIAYVLAGVIQAYEKDDKLKCLYLFEFLVILIVVQIKITYFLLRKEKILQFLYDLNVTHQNANHDESELVNCANKKIGLFNKMYIPFTNVTTMFLMFSLLPIFTGDKYSLPFFMEFNVDCDYKRVVYWIVFASVWISSCISCMYGCSMTIIWYILHNYAIDYKLLGQRLRSLGTATTSYYEKDLIRLVKDHQKLFAAVEEFRSFFAELFLAQILVGAMSICLSTFNLVNGSSENLLYMGINVAVIIYALFEISLLMYLGNEITLASDQLSYCLFESNWIDQSESTKKCFIVFGEILMNPQQMVVLIYPLNLEMLVTIVNGAYSMFNILQNFK